eukprot:TRINITY_DN2649_c0_g1_i2.p1 TRINITY_DN2649_c0_g1~~TRINITY_DN2649_c0_g1_i2.p1  ORF type:complete len:419 (-),score=91.77 TRINITY_DN2649_c0_g1_i2:342-1538(-)
MAESTFAFSSESVTEGHPNKLCDRVAEAVLDACLAEDPDALVRCEACTKTNMVMVLGEVVTKASVEYDQVIREAVKAVGFDSDEKGMDASKMNIIVALEEQAPDLAQAFSAKAQEDGDEEEHGTCSGYATDETPELMPLSHVLASKLCSQLDKARKAGTLPWARPAASSQVVVEYRTLPDGGLRPVRIRSVSVAARPMGSASAEQVEKDLRDHVVRPVLPAALCDQETLYHLRPPRSAGAQSDTGLSGRQPAADGYGGWGSDAFASPSGLDGSRLRRCGAYGARWVARSLVEAKLCKRCLVQVCYTRGSAAPSAIRVDSYGSCSPGLSDADLAARVQRSFDLRPSSLQRCLGLKKPQFQRLAAHGHFGRGVAGEELPETPGWEVSKALTEASEAPVLS